MSLPSNSKWLFILGGGVIPLTVTPNSYRLSPITSIFMPGDSVTSGFNRKDLTQLSNAYHEFREFESKFKSNSFSAYTDGSSGGRQYDLAYL